VGGIGEAGARFRGYPVNLVRSQSYDLIDMPIRGSRELLTTLAALFSLLVGDTTPSLPPISIKANRNASPHQARP